MMTELSPTARLAVEDGRILHERERLLRKPRHAAATSHRAASSQSQQVLSSVCCWQVCVCRGLFRDRGHGMPGSWAGLSVTVSVVGDRATPGRVSPPRHKCVDKCAEGTCRS